MSLDAMKPFLARLAEGERLSEQDLSGAFSALMDGSATPAQIGAFLLGLRRVGETQAEIVAGARAMRARMTPVAAPSDAIDVCGTGGDGAHTLNVSTAVSFVLAGAGIPVAKHGNRAMSSKSGGADALEALGLPLAADPATLARALREARIAFLFAQAHHPAMAHVGPARRELGFRTVFNLLGPLSNPAGVTRQLTGVFSARWLEPMAQALQALGAKSFWVVHGLDGLDELSPAGPSDALVCDGGPIQYLRVTPQDAGLPAHPLDAIRGADPAYNAKKLKALLEGETGPYRDAVLLNAAAGLIVAQKAQDLREGAHLAARAIDSGAARAAFDTLRAILTEPRNGG